MNKEKLIAEFAPIIEKYYGNVWQTCVEQCAEAAERVIFDKIEKILDGNISTLSTRRKAWEEINKKDPTEREFTYYKEREMAIEGVKKEIMALKTLTNGQ